MNRLASRRAVLALAALLLPACAAASGGSARGTPPLTAAQVQSVYERFRALDGAWTGTSTKGWTDAVTYRTVADGSAVMETSDLAHEGTTMVTMIHPDGDRLLLTHYCAAHNQPRLQASRVDGNEVTFTFLDGTNLPSRDTGHMDKVLVRFEDGDHVTARWSWYQDGDEQWMEEVHLTRVKPG